MFRPARPLLATLVFCLAATATAAAIYRVGEAVYPQTPPLGIWTVIKMGVELAKVEAEAADGDVATVLFMGDSTVMAYPPGHTLFEYLQREFDTHAMDGLPAREVRVHSVAAQGMTPGNYYLALDNIIKAKPDLVAITINLGVVRSYLPPVLRRPELAGWMRARRLPRALFRLPLHHYGVTADQLLLHQFFVRENFADDWFRQRREQARVGHLREEFENYVAERTGCNVEPAMRAGRKNLKMRRQTLPEDSRRFNSRRAQDFFGLSMRGLDADHFTMVVMEAMLEELEEAGIRAFLYVVPTNIDHLRRVGVYDEAGLAKTLATFEAAARHHEADFADFHALLSDAAFRDAFGHLYHEEPWDGPQRLAREMYPAVYASLRRALRDED